MESLATAAVPPRESVKLRLETVFFSENSDYSSTDTQSRRVNEIYINKKVVGMYRKLVFAFLTTLLFAFCTSGSAQQPGKIPRIGYVNLSTTATNAPRFAEFRQGLRDLGYVEGKNIVIEYRSSEGRCRTGSPRC